MNIKEKFYKYCSISIDSSVINHQYLAGRKCKRIWNIINTYTISKKSLVQLKKQGYSVNSLKTLFKSHISDIKFILNFFDVNFPAFLTKSKSITKTQLVDLYVTKKLTTTEIEKYLDIPATIVGKLLKKYNISIRTRSEWWNTLSNSQRYSISKKIYEGSNKFSSYDDHIKRTSEYKKYKKEVEKLSVNQLKKQSPHEFNKRGHQTDINSKSIDHIVPIKFAFVNNISATVVSRKENLRMVKHKINSSKNLYLTKDSFEILEAWGKNKIIQYSKLKFEGFIK